MDDFDADDVAGLRRNLEVLDAFAAAELDFVGVDVVALAKNLLR